MMTISSARKRFSLLVALPSGPKLIRAVVLTVFGLGVFGIWWGFFHKSNVDQGLAALRQAYPLTRPTEARLSAWNRYAPFARERGYTQAEVNSTDHDLAGLLLLEAANSHPGPAAWHALGQFYLTDKRFDQAIDLLKRAVDGEAKNAQFRSDLAAAYYEKASSGEDLPEVFGIAIRALEEACVAVQLQPSLLSAQFNRSLCLKQLNLVTMETQAWNNYIEKDPHSAWSQEARRDLNLAQEQANDDKTPDQVADDFLAAVRSHDDDRAWKIESQTKEMITGVMVPFQLARRFLVADLAGSIDQSTELLKALTYVGKVEKDHSGDGFFEELASFYSNARSSEESLRQAQDALSRGYQFCLQSRYTDAAASFEEAQQIFVADGDTWEEKCSQYWLAYCASLRGERQRHADLLSALDQYCTSHRYYWLESQVHLGLANASALARQYSEREDQLSKALEIGATGGDLYVIQKSSCQLATDYSFVNNFEESMRLHGESLRPAEAYFTSQRQALRSLSLVADSLFGFALSHAAQCFEEEALSKNKFGDPVFTFSSYLHLGEISVAGKDYQAAERYFAKSLTAIPDPKDDPANKLLFGQHLLAKGNLERDLRDYNAALGCYEQAFETFGSGLPVLEYQARKRMLVCHLLNKDVAAVRAELPAVLDLFDQNRRAIRDQESRNHFFDTEQDVYDLAVDYQYAAGTAEDSFNYAETSRARSLLDSISVDSGNPTEPPQTGVGVSAAAHPLTLTQVQEQLPPDLQLVEYAVLEDRLVLWLVTKTDRHVFEQQVSREALETLANDYLEAMTRPDAQSIVTEQALAAKLYDLLWARLQDWLNPSQEVVLVPDKFLFKVPFCALMSPANQHRLVEDYTILYSPSASVLIRCSDLAKAKGGDKAKESILTVGDPAFSLVKHPECQRLPSAITEAEVVGALYQEHLTLVDRQAQKSRVTAAMPRFDVIDIAGHYLAEPLSEERSRLLLAATTTGPDENYSQLSLREIQTSHFPRAKLATLSACQTGVERYYGGEGLIGLSRAFIEAGVPLVVGTQWAVESDSSARLIENLHRLRKIKNLTTTAALRQAQCEMLSGGDEIYRRPFYWAAFIPIGGHADY